MSHQVIIADDDAGLLNILSRRVRNLGFDVEEASDGLMASLGLFVGTDSWNAPELIILDVNMPIDDGLSICDVMRREQAFANVPVIMMTGRSDARTIQRCRELGAHYVHKSGDVWKKLEPLILELTKNSESDRAQAAGEKMQPPSAPRNHRPEAEMSRSEIRRVEPMSTEGNPCQIRGFMEQDMITMPMPTSMSMPMSMSMPRSRPPEGRNALPERGSKPMGDMPAEMKVMSSSGMPPDAQLPKVLLVDDDQELTIAIEKRLTEAGFEVKRASTCVDGYWTALKEQPDAIVADYVMPDSYGSYLVRRLREHPLTKNIPVIVLTGCDLAGRTTSRSDYSLERQFLNMGAETVLRKPIDHQSLVHEIRRHVHFPVQTHIERMRELEPCS